MPFTSYRNCDRHKWLGGLISDSLLEQQGSVWVGFIANMLQVKQASLQPLTERGYCLPHSCAGQAEDNNEETKHVLATHWGEEELEKNCQVSFFLSQPLLSDVVFVSTPLAPGESSFSSPQHSTRYQDEIALSLVMDHLVEGEVREQIGSFQHLREHIYTHIPFLIIHVATYIIHHKVQFHLAMLNMQNPILFCSFSSQRPEYLKHPNVNSVATFASSSSGQIGKHLIFHSFSPFDEVISFI